jgi:hypothetical protein
VIPGQTDDVILAETAGTVRIGANPVPLRFAERADERTSMVSNRSFRLWTSFASHHSTNDPSR